MKKKVVLLLTAIIMTISLSACSLFGGDKLGSGSHVDEVAGYTKTDGVEDYTTTDDGRKVDGYQIAFLEDTVETAWFNFCVHSVEFVDEYEGLTPSEGNILAVANITMKNTFDDPVDMYYNDFWLAWDLDADYLSYATEIAMFSDGEDLGSTYTMEDNEKFNADYVFELPENTQGPRCV